MSEITVSITVATDPDDDIHPDLVRDDMCEVVEHAGWKIVRAEAAREGEQA